MTGAQTPYGGEGNSPRSRLGYGFGSAPLPEPRRVSPRLAVLVAACGGVGEGRHLPPIQDQLPACRERVQELGGSFDPRSEVFVAQCGREAPSGPAVVLESAVREGLFDGVVVADLGVLPVGRYQVFAFRLALVAGACELYVVDRPELSLWGDGSAGFDAAALSADRDGSESCHIHHPAPQAQDEAETLPFNLLRTPEVLLRRRVWPSPSHPDPMHGLTPAVATATFLLDTAEAELSEGEDAVLEQGGDGSAGAALSVKRLEAASQRYRLARIRLLILRELAGRGGSDV